jgi:hypothetical protein
METFKLNFPILFIKTFGTNSLLIKSSIPKLDTADMEINAKDRDREGEDEMNFVEKSD